MAEARIYPSCSPFSFSSLFPPDIYILRKKKKRCIVCINGVFFMLIEYKLSSLVAAMRSVVFAMTFVVFAFSS